MRTVRSKLLSGRRLAREAAARRRAIFWWGVSFGGGLVVLNWIWGPGDALLGALLALGVKEELLEA